jgi:hypothetical protein
MTEWDREDLESVVADMRALREEMVDYVQICGLDMAAAVFLLWVAAAALQNYCSFRLWLHL